MVGASMGGMIAQLIAAHYPERTLSLTSIMSTTGHRSLPRADRDATKALMLQPEDPGCMDSIVERNVRVRKALQSRSHPKSDEEIRETAAAAVARGGHNPDGVARQLAAIIAAKERRALLRKVQSAGAGDPRRRGPAGQARVRRRYRQASAQQRADDHAGHGPRLTAAPAGGYCPGNSQHRAKSVRRSTAVTIRGPKKRHAFCGRQTHFFIAANGC
jgi:pimeloyl-ACP methyl ester carboxylesterase